MEQRFTRKKITFSLIAMLIAILGSIVLDQVTKRKAESELKVWAHETDLKSYRGKRFPLHEIGEWTPSDMEQKLYIAFAFNYVRNQGAAWGTFSDMPDSFRIPFFYVVTFIAILVILLYIKNTPVEHRLARMALGIILSGALGNLIDRILLGYVIDFIDVRWIFPIPFTDMAWRYNFPNFNWADSCISVGVGLLIFDMIFLEPKRVRAAKEQKA